ncbi:hypothetical protein [Streptomyces showdoensis]|uniref:PE-PGRS family protein n=2 Tax=Streptomyces showdoensis TaxID=68268 RepID=A0A2P2GP97_STREW|nr:hypothetical protein [Streptomyces showdoensis]KKZ73320.1 hypothetical protein VO63_13480 [Streptomyces showdoensis]
MFAAVCVLLAATGHILMSGRPVAGWVLGAAFAATAAAAWATAARERGLFAVTAAAVAVQTVLHSVFSWAQSGGGAAHTGMGAGSGSGAGTGSGGGSVSAASGTLSSAHMAHPAMGAPDMGPADMGPADMAHLPGLGVDVVQVGDAGHVAMAHLPVASDAHDMASMVSSLAHAADLTDFSLSSSFGMLAAHVLAALLSGVWLAYGERGAFRLLRALPAGLFRPLSLLLAVVPVVVGRPRVRPVRPGDARVPRRLHLAHSLVSRGPPQAVAVV